MIVSVFKFFLLSFLARTHIFIDFTASFSLKYYFSGKNKDEDKKEQGDLEDVKVQEKEVENDTEVEEETAVEKLSRFIAFLVYCIIIRFSFVSIQIIYAK